VANRLSTARIPQDYKKEFERIVDFMNQGQSLDGQFLRKEIQQVDHRRNENLARVFPELARALGYE
jgi:hypothetical protein